MAKSNENGGGISGASTTNTTTGDMKLLREGKESDIDGFGELGSGVRGTYHPNESNGAGILLTFAEGYGK